MAISIQEEQRPNGTGREVTLTSEAYHRLRDDILWGRLEADRKLRVQELKELYGMGSSPLREALSRLAESGLVERMENRGFRVCAMTVAELEELMKTRCWLEEIALRDSIRHGDQAWEGRIVLALHWLTRTGRFEEDSHQTTPKWEKLHRDYHLALLSACTSKSLVDFCDQLLHRTLRYRNVAGSTEHREAEEKEEHRLICEAALSRHEDEAVQLMHAHYRRALTVVIESGVLPQPENLTELPHD